MHSRTPARLVAVLATVASGVVIAAPAARADANLTALTLPPSITAGASAASSFSFTTANAPLAPLSGSATIVLSGATGLTAATVSTTCDSNAATSETPSSDGSSLTIVCTISTGNGAHTGTLQIARGAQGARVGNGTLHVAVTTTVSGLLSSATGTNAGDTTLYTPPSISETPTDIPADGAGHDVAVTVSNHSPVAGKLFRADLAITGAAAQTATIALVGSNGTTTPLTFSGNPLSGSLTRQTGVTFADDGTFTFSYRVTVPVTTHGSAVSYDLKLNEVSSTGTVTATDDEDTDASTISNKPSITSDLPTQVTAGATASTFTQHLGNRSGTGYTTNGVELHYSITAPAGLAGSAIHLSIDGGSGFTAVALSGSGPTYTGTYPASAGIPLPDSNSTVDLPSKLAVDGGVPSGDLSWSITVNDHGTGKAQLSDTYAPKTTVGTPPHAPTAVTTVGANRRLAVSFTPGDTGSAAPITFTATATPTTGGSAVTATGTSSPVTITGLVNNVTYNVTVHTTNALGTSAESSPVVTGKPVPSVPGAPTIARIDPYDGYAIATIIPPTDDGGTPITSYRASFFRTDGTGSASSVIEDSGDNTVTLPGLTNNVQYTVVLRAVNAVGVGPTSTPGYVTAALPGGPTSPAGIAVFLGATTDKVNSGGSVTLSGQVTRNDDPQAGMKVKITYHSADKKTATLATVTTDSAGAFTLKTKPKIRGYWLAQVTSVNPAVASAHININVLAVLKSVRITTNGHVVTATGYVTPGYSKVTLPKVQLQVVKVVKVAGVPVTRVIKTFASAKIGKQVKAGNPFTITFSGKPGTYLVRVATTTTYLLNSGGSKPSTIKLQ